MNFLCCFILFTVRRNGYNEVEFHPNYRQVFMPSSAFVPLVELTRGSIVESTHYGAVVVSDAAGTIIFSLGDPATVAFLRSSAKPFQALPFLESGGMEHFGLTQQELAIMCASHHGTDAHMQVIESIQRKVGIIAEDLLCGMHPPADRETAARMVRNTETNSPLRHNCSGKHSGMLAHALLRGFPTADYINPAHPVQQVILQVFSEMTGVPVDQVILGTDGCSAPVFAIPMDKAARAFALLADPSSLPQPRQAALRQIYSAMTSYPDMVAGPKGFDTAVMRAGKGSILAKGGAEGYLALALKPGACGAGSPAYGITIKIVDGDQSSPERARPVAAIQVLRHLGALDDEQVAELSNFAARPIHNWRKIPVGEIRPAF
jgi:L-asparaginase II